MHIFKDAFETSIKKVIWIYIISIISIILDVFDFKSYSIFWFKEFLYAQIKWIIVSDSFEK
jgi:hypothetical protein